MFHASITLTEWLSKATPQQREELSKRSATAAGHLYQIATGRRNASASKAADIEAATLAVAGLPPVLRTTSCKACASCPYAQRCANGSAEAV